MAGDDLSWACRNLGMGWNGDGIDQWKTSDKDHHANIQSR